MFMNTGHQPHPHRPPHRLRHPPLIHAPQPRIPPMPYPSHTRHKLGHDGEILELVEGMHAEDVEDVAGVLFVGAGMRFGDVAAEGGAGAPFLLLGGGEVVRGVDVARAETSVEVAFEVGGAVGGFGFGEGAADLVGGAGLSCLVAGDGGDDRRHSAGGLGGGFWGGSVGEVELEEGGGRRTLGFGLKVWCC